jgi:hypothetical protein
MYSLQNTVAIIPGTGERDREVRMEKSGERRGGDERRVRDRVGEIGADFGDVAIRGRGEGVENVGDEGRGAAEGPDGATIAMEHVVAVVPDH